MRKIRIIASLLIFLSTSFGYVFGFTTNNTTITRTFNKSNAAINELITVTVNFTNNEASSLRGFYYAEEIPQGLVVSTTSVKINGVSVSDYIFESGSVGDVYPGNVVYRWILETPTAFTENNPIPSGMSTEIVYSITSAQAGTFNLDEFDWVGYYQGGSEAAFGHSEVGDKKSINIVPTISGSAGVAGATLSYTDGTPKTATADGSGNYSFTVSYNWSGTVTPTKTGYTFTPANKAYTNVLSNQSAQNYTATAITFTISGSAGVAGATLSYTDGTPKTATADGSGNYSFAVSYNWSGTVTPTKTGYSFSPASRTYTNVVSNQSAQNYTATLQTFTISGYVRTSGGTGISGVVMSGLPGSPSTGADGFYSGTVDYGWPGTVTPTKAGYTFSPPSSTYSNVTSNQEQNYTGTKTVTRKDIDNKIKDFKAGTATEQEVIDLINSYMETP